MPNVKCDETGCRFNEGGICDRSGIELDYAGTCLSYEEIDEG